MKTLTVPIQLKNITKIIVDKFDAREDEAPPFAIVSFHLEDNDGKLYMSSNLKICDTQNSDAASLNLASSTVFDKVLVGKTQINNAYTALVTAVGTLQGSAKKSAVETACISLGIFGTGLAAA